MSNLISLGSKKKFNKADKLLKKPLHSDLEYYKSRVLVNIYNFSISTNAFTKFFYASRLHFIIILEISIGKMKSFESLCEKIPNPIGKRTTIQTILNEAVAMNLLLKYPCVKDKRIKFYKLTEDSEQTLKEWAEANIV
tara:strand:+ start:114 stop:527 length:414 start_codon:yes stop_codon:yes gene_type:complete